MKIVGMREVQQCLRNLMVKAQRERVIITRHGRPVAMLVGVDGRGLTDLVEEDRRTKRCRAR